MPLHKNDMNKARNLLLFHINFVKAVWEYNQKLENQPEVVID